MHETNFMRLAMAALAALDLVGCPGHPCEQEQKRFTLDKRALYFASDVGTRISDASVEDSSSLPCPAFRDAVRHLELEPGEGAAHLREVKDLGATCEYIFGVRQCAPLRMQTEP
jgi:hypothetical protein